MFKVMNRDPRIPLCVLDVDGVVFPRTDHAPDLVGRALRLAGFRVVLPRVVEEGLAAAISGADLVWLTSWEQDAPSEIAPLLGLPDAPALPLRRCTIAEKQQRLEEICGKAPLVWVDDQLGAAARRLAAARPAPTLLIKPDARRGLGARQLARVASFIATHRSEA